MRVVVGSILMTLGVPSAALAAGAEVNVPVWSAGPFLLLLLAIALFPLLAERWWHSNRNKGIVVVVIAVPSAIYLVSLGDGGREALLHELAHYFSFISLLVALYVISGGIVLRGDLAGRPRTNLLFLAAGTVLANFIG